MCVDSRRFAPKILCVLIATVLPMVAHADWPAFRGPTRDGISTDSHIPLHWSSSENIQWKQPIPGRGWSSPVLVDGRIYLTTATGEVDDDNVSLRALCLEAIDGQVLWNVQVFQPDVTLATQKHKKNGLASPTPIIDGGHVYVHFGHMGTAALDLDGNVVWRQTGIKYLPMHGVGGSPALAGDTLVFSCDGDDTQHVIGLDRATGGILWKTPRNTHAIKRFSFSTPQVIEVNGQQQAISPGSGLVAAFDPANGDELWRVKYGEGFSVVPRPVYSHGRLYVITGFMRASLLAIEPVNASGDATDSNVVWQHAHGVPRTPSPLVVGDEIYFVSDNGVASCLDAHTGEVHWNKRLGGDFSASPIFADGRIYFTSEEGKTSVVRQGIEYELLATNDLDERTFASLATTNGALLIRSESHLWRVGR